MDDKIKYLEGIIDTCNTIIEKDGWGEELDTPVLENHKIAERMMIDAWNQIIHIIEKKGGDE